MARPNLAPSPPPRLLPPLLLLSEAALSRDRVVKCEGPAFSQRPSGTRSRACVRSAVAHQGCVRGCRLGTHTRHTWRRLRPLTPDAAAPSVSSVGFRGRGWIVVSVTGWDSRKCRPRLTSNSAGGQHGRRRGRADVGPQRPFRASLTSGLGHVQSADAGREDASQGGALPWSRTVVGPLAHI